MLMKLLMMAGYQFGMISIPNQLESLTLPKMELTQPSLNMIKLALMAFRQLDLMVPLLILKKAMKKRLIPQHIPCFLFCRLQ